MKWFAVRTIFHFGIKEDGKNVFEERTVVFSGESAEEAFEKADAEVEEYSKCDDRADLAIHPSKELYIQDGDPLIDGYEVWSQLFETTETMEEFFKNRYERYEYTPD
ncbi:DUF4288 domain-containing protein [Microbulbifer sp. OS29]|uniref:DUF4288 domain-containing protein n=1 Tax=Microbulbifer okhotskensis TaxID=2926617 RepID=A0A9X2EWX7_9GAMM|nr:DUF4288 domain-containing protein [Microbulbifer okhotskensis]MCO1336843.1 DUF4288 domain-containing protein [Microbulbifer okhotskensis]